MSDAPRTGTQSIGELGRYFSSGFQPKVANGYIARLYREDFTNPDISEGVERVIAIRTQRTFPSFAELRSKVADARSERLAAHRDHERHERGPALWGTEAQKEAAILEFRELRAKMKSGELVFEEEECPWHIRQTSMPVRGVRKSSPAYRNEDWWLAHPKQPAGVTLRTAKMQWVSWDNDRRPWAEAEALHAKLSGSIKPKRVPLTPLSDLVTADSVDLF